MKKEKKYIIYGKNRFQRDFEYIFHQYNIAYYVDEEASNDVRHFSVLENENKDTICVIICMENSAQARAMVNLQMLDLIYNVHFFFMEDLFEGLDINILELTKGKKVVLWGTGHYGQNFMKQYRETYPKLKLDYVADNSLSKSRTFYEYPVFSLAELKELKEDYFIIIAIAEYRRDELLQQLKEYGLDKNYCFSTQLLLEKPSKMLARTIYDKRQFSTKMCPKINDFRILNSGKITSCCMSHVTLGNLFCNDVEDIWNSAYEKIFRLSILNRTYTFCDHTRCPYIVHREEKENVGDEIFTYKDMKPESPNLLTLDLEGSCNLMCVSCRNHVYTLESEYFDIYTKRIIDCYIGNMSRVAITGNSEIFVSKYAKQIVLSQACLGKGEVSILSNGLSFNEMNWKKYLQNYKKVNVSISIDGATKYTHESIRRNSNWEIVNQNLDFIRKLKEAGRVKFFQINFVVQKSNISEMKAFVELGKMYNVDRIIFNRLEDWGVDSNWYFENTVVDENFKIKAEFKKYLIDIKDEPIVDLNNLAHDLGVEPKDAFMW